MSERQRFEDTVYSMVKMDQKRDSLKEEMAHRAKPLSEQLIAEAEAEERRAEQLRGCSFHGEWPGASRLRRASMLRMAAAALAAVERRKTKRRVKAHEANQEKPK